MNNKERERERKTILPPSWLEAQPVRTEQRLHGNLQTLCRNDQEDSNPERRRAAEGRTPSSHPPHPHRHHITSTPSSTPSPPSPHHHIHTVTTSHLHPHRHHIHRHHITSTPSSTPSPLRLEYQRETRSGSWGPGSKSMQKRENHLSVECLSLWGCGAAPPAGRSPSLRHRASTRLRSWTWTCSDT